MSLGGFWYVLPGVEIVSVTHFIQPELAHPLHILEPHCEITMASHLGGEAPLDPLSIESFKSDDISCRFLQDHESLWKNTIKLEDFVGKAHQFDAILYVGGYGRKSWIKAAS
jgi:hypothetical protein